MSKTPDITVIDNIETAEEAINDNFANISASFENTLSLDGSSPNAMLAELDMNSNRIINIPIPTLSGDVVTLGYFDANTGSSTPAVENKLKVSVDDQTVGFLSEKVTTSDGLSTTITSPGVDEGFEFSLVIAADSGLEEVVTGLQVKDGEGIGVDNDGVNLDFPTLTNLAGVDLDGADSIAVYDASAMQHKELTITDLAANLPTSPDASESVKGLVELATTTEAAAGTDTTRAVTAAGVASAITERQQLMHLTYEVSSGTAGQVMSSSFTKRSLNTIKVNTITGSGVASSVITLPAGTYKCDFSAVMYQPYRGVFKLRNTTASTDLGWSTPIFHITGTGGSADVTSNFTLSGKAVFTLGVSSTIELQGVAVVAAQPQPSSFGIETYATMLIEKLV